MNEEQQQSTPANGSQATNGTDFLEAAKPLIKYLNDNHHPHCSVIVTQTSAELLEGIKHTGEIFDFVKD